MFYAPRSCVNNCPTIRMWDVKYIGNIITALFLLPMNDVILEYMIKTLIMQNYFVFANVTIYKYLPNFSPEGDNL
jgi:hypothetical protein